jgi:hypothetical protein
VESNFLITLTSDKRKLFSNVSEQNHERAGQMRFFLNCGMSW